MNPIKTLAAGVGTAALVVLMSACGQSTDEAKADFCDSLDEFSSSAMSYQGLDPRTATNSQLDDAADELDSAWDAVQEDALDFYYADDNELTEAYNDLYDAAQSLDADNTASENLSDLEPELEAIPGAFWDTFDGSGCADVDS
jgi:hypothetical protein